MRLQARRRAVLDLLLNNHGGLEGSKLSSNQKKIATQMERDHLVIWIGAAIGGVLSRDYQILKLTKAGLTALREDAAMADEDGPPGS